MGNCGIRSVRSAIVAVTLMVAIFCGSSLYAQLVSDDFDSYAAGSLIAGQGAWDTWDQDPNVDAEVSNNIASSLPNSLELQPFDDIVRLFSGINTGVFVFTSNVLIPAGQSGTYYFILLNTYAHNGPKNWSVQIAMSDASGMVSDAGGSSAPTATSTPVPIIYNAWAEVRVEIDFIANTYNAFYNGQPVMVGNTWAGAGGQPQLECLDLYNDGGGTFYYDDVVVDCSGGCGGCLPFDTMDCTIDCVTNNVDLNWSTFQPGGYAGGIDVVRNGTVIASLLGNETSYSDVGAPAGLLNYEIVGDCGTMQIWTAACSLACTGACPPASPGDECCDAQPAVLGVNTIDTTLLSDSPDSIAGSLCTGTFLGDFTADGWLTYTALSNGFLEVSSCAGGVDTDILVYTGDCATKVDVGCIGDNCGVAGEVTIPVTAGTEYTIRVGLWSPAVALGLVDIEITELCEIGLGALSSALDCNAGDVTLSWTPGNFDSFDVARDGVTIATGLPAGTASYLDPGLVAGAYAYDVIGNCVALGTSDSASIAVTVDSGFGVSDLILRGETATGDTDSVAALEAALIANGLAPIILDGGPEAIACLDDSALERVWYMGGTFPDQRALTAADGVALVALQALGKGIYVESGDTWGFNAPTAFNDIDGIADGIADGDDSFTGMNGADSGFGLDTSDLMGIAYAQDQRGPGENDWTDQLILSATDTLGPNSATIWSEGTGLYDTGVFYSVSSGGNVISKSWEFGGFALDPLDPLASDAARADLASRYLAAYGSTPVTEAFQRADCNADSLINIGDAIFGLGALFPPSGGSPNVPQCDDACDANDDGLVNIGDMITILGSLFPPAGAPPTVIPPPFGACGADPTADGLDCATNTNPC